jgi:cytochrome P450
MLEALFDRFPAIQMIQSADELRWRHTGVFRGLEELLVRPSPG